MSRVVVVGAGPGGLGAAATLAEAGHTVTLVDRDARPCWPRATVMVAGALDGLRALCRRVEADSLVPRTPRDRPLERAASLLLRPGLTLRDRAALGRLAARVLRPSLQHLQASDYQSATAWLDEQGLGITARAAIFAPLLSLLGQPGELASARSLERLFRDALTAPNATLAPVPLTDDVDLVAATRGFLEARGGALRPSAPVARIIVDDHRARAVILADGEELLLDAIVVDLPPRALLQLLPPAERDDEPYFDALARLNLSVLHRIGGEAARPRSRTPVGGLFLASDFVRTGLPASPESAVAAADEAVRLVAELTQSASPRPSSSAGAFVPAAHLRRGAPVTRA